jgi:hypothetical protein
MKTYIPSTKNALEATNRVIKDDGQPTSAHQWAKQNKNIICVYDDNKKN